MVDGDEIERREVAGEAESQASLIEGERVRRQEATIRSQREIAAANQSFGKLRSAGFYELPEGQRHDIAESFSRPGRRQSGGAA